MEKFNFEEDDGSSFSGYRPASVSSNTSDGRFDSATGSINSRTSNSRLSLTLSEKKNSLNRKQQMKKSKSLDRKPSQNFSFGLKLKVKKTKQINGDIHRKQNKQNFQTNSDKRGRDISRSSTAKKLLSSIRNSARKRSGSRERKGSNSNLSYNSENECELSSDIALPGILKIFGDAVSPGANYKSVLATQQSNARELVKAALERYGVSRNTANKFVLCEVVGRVNIDAKQAVQNDNSKLTDVSSLDSFAEDYFRPLSDHEKPLILQSYWKPLDGYARRFEIRRKSKVQEINEKDTETHDVNSQAKRLIIQKSRMRKTSSIGDVRMSKYSSSSESEEEANLISERKCHSDTEKIKTTTLDNESQSSVSRQSSIVETPPNQFADDENNTSNNYPYLMTLQGERGLKGSSDRLIQKLSERLTLGGDVTAKKHPLDVVMSGRNTSECHCVITCVKTENEDAKSDWKITMDVLNDYCSVSVNGVAAASSIELAGGSIISIEEQYIFMLKDPTSDKKLSNSVRFSFGIPNGHPHSAFTPVATKKRKVIRTEICFESMYSEQVLDAIFVAAHDIVIARTELFCDTTDTEKELSPAKFMCFCIEHACLNFYDEDKKEFLYKMASKLQSAILETTAAVSKLQNSEKIKDPDKGIGYLLPYLKPVVFWMSNALEIFSFLQSDIEEIIKTRVEKEKEENDYDEDMMTSALEFQISEDILAILEEVVMYSFQQLVYYLTKTLYGALPSLLDSNPFATINDDDSLLCRDGNSRIIAIYEAAKGLTRTFGVHKDIENQLFAYLFFFTSISLFNTLMGDETGPPYYKWEKGVQIRGNLEEIEMWAIDHGFQEQSSMFLQKFSILANLLATPRSQMLKCTWSNFRRDFKQLHPSQLRQILEKYNLPLSKPRPVAWLPDANDLEESTEDQFLMESYDNHPPLVLPTDGVQLDLKTNPEEDWYPSLRDFLTAVGMGKSLSTISNSDSAYQSINRDGEIEPMKRRANDSGHNASDASSQASLTESEINNNTIVRHKINSLTTNFEENESIVSSSFSHTSSKASSTIAQHKQSSTIITTVPDSPVPVPRKNVTPVPSPRHYNVSSSTSTTSTTSGCVRSASDLNSGDDFTLKGLYSPERNVAQILLNNVSERYADNFKRGFKSDGSVILTTDDESSVNTNADADSPDMQVLPLHNIEVKHSAISRTNSRDHEIGSASSGSTTESERSEGNQLMPNEVFVVDVVKGKDGLGLGLVDGMYTSLKVNGLFVRSLVPDGPSVKHLHLKHQEVIRCWLQDGRLNLGDRILAVNGQSLLTTNYRSAIKILRHSGDKMRFLVGRCGPDVAMKITSSSC